MLKTGGLLLLLLMAVQARAQTQTGVSLYGVVDAGLTYSTHQASAQAARLSVDPGNLQVSRWGVRGQEQLNAGTRVFFQLESTLTNDTGSAGAGFGGNQFSQSGNAVALFDRAALLGISGPYGTLSAGRQNILGVESVGRADPADLAHAVTNPNVLLSGMYAGSLYGGFGSNRGGPALRQNNSLKYLSPAYSGAGFALMLAAGEQAGSLNAAAYAGASAYYSNGRDGVALAYGQFRDQSGQAKLQAWATGLKWRYSDLLAFRVSYATDVVRGDIVIPVPGNPQANANGRRIRVLGAGADLQLQPQLVWTVAAYQSRRSGDSEGRATQYLSIVKYQLSPRSTLYASLTLAQAASSDLSDTLLALGLIGPGSGYRSAWRSTAGIVHQF